MAAINSPQYVVYIIITRFPWYSCLVFHTRPNRHLICLSCLDTMSHAHLSESLVHLRTVNALKTRINALSLPMSAHHVLNYVLKTYAAVVAVSVSIACFIGRKNRKSNASTKRNIKWTTHVNGTATPDISLDRILFLIGRRWCGKCWLLLIPKSLLTDDSASLHCTVFI